MLLFLLDAILAVTVTRTVLTVSVLAGFVIGGVALWFVHREVARMQAFIESQEARIDTVEDVLGRLEERWSAGQ